MKYNKYISRKKYIYNIIDNYKVINNYHYNFYYILM